MGEREGGTVTVYHGSTEQVKTPVCHLGRINLDFGQGFYVTDLKEQAVRWAVTTGKKRGKAPLLNIYRLNREAILSEARCKIFKAYDREWLDFIADSRHGKNPAAAYDYIEGGVANDRVVDTVRLYIDGLVDAETALQRLAKHQPNNQMCLLDQRLINKYLVYERTESI